MRHGKPEKSLQRIPEPEVDVEEEYNLTKNIPAPPTGGSVTVDDIVGLDEYLGISSDEIVTSSSMAAVESEPDDEALNSIPDEILQKKPAEIDELIIPDNVNKLEEPKIVTSFFRSADIEELDPQQEIAKRRAQPEPVKHAEPVPEIEPEVESEPIIEKSGVEMSLDEFETAMKKLRSMLDNGVITSSEFAQEKRKLLSNLY